MAIVVDEPLLYEKRVLLIELVDARLSREGLAGV